MKGAKGGMCSIKCPINKQRCPGVNPPISFLTANTTDVLHRQNYVQFYFQGLPALSRQDTHFQYISSLVRDLNVHVCVCRRIH